MAHLALIEPEGAALLLSYLLFAIISKNVENYFFFKFLNYIINSESESLCANKLVKQFKTNSIHKNKFKLFRNRYVIFISSCGKYISLS